MTPIILTPSQQTALEAFQRFLNGTEQVFILKGAAGTGKTTLISELLCLLRNANRQFCLMAPTGRAAFIIGNKTKTPAYTIHRSIYSLTRLQPTEHNQEEGEDGGLHAQFGLKKNSDSPTTIYIVDEASMISDAYSDNEAFTFGSGCLLQDLMGYVNGRKIIFVGDYAQLPPIGMNFSPALDADYLSRKYNCTVAEWILREVVRQGADSSILSNATKIRDSIEAKTFIEFKLADAEDCLSADSDLLQPYYQLSAEKPSAKAAVITYSNKQALLYNRSIRKHYFGEDVPQLITGELLMIARNNYAYPCELFNGNIVVVVACESDADVVRRNIRIKIGKDRIESVELRFRQVTIRFNAGDHAEEQSVVILENCLEDPTPSIGGLLSRALVVDFNTRLPQDIQCQLSTIKRLLRSKSQLSSEQQALCDKYTTLLSSDRYYNAVICKYGYAVTCHKAQGGEWENVFVDMCRFGGTANEAYFRWVYTAITRAGKRLWHYRSPEFNYISNLVVADIQKSDHLAISTYRSPDAEDFCVARFQRLQELAKQYELSVTDDKSRSFQHWISFSDGRHERATFILWYKQHGYNGKTVRQNTSSEEFAVLCNGLLDKSLIPGQIPFSPANRPFAQKLHDYMLTLFDELDIQLLDIVQEQYQDTYHVKTDGLAKVAMAYNAKGNYTYMKPISTLGSEDAKLVALCAKFK
jgi:hypothetical protein